MNKKITEYSKFLVGNYVKVKDGGDYWMEIIGIDEENKYSLKPIMKDVKSSNFQESQLQGIELNEEIWSSAQFREKFNLYDSHKIEIQVVTFDSFDREIFYIESRKGNSTINFGIIALKNLKSLLKNENVFHLHFLQNYLFDNKELDFDKITNQIQIDRTAG